MSIKLFCGDCLEILPGLDAVSVDCIITDPPYGTGEHLRVDGKLVKTRQDWDTWDIRWLGYWDGPLAMFCPSPRLSEGLRIANRLLAWISPNPLAMNGVSPRYGIRPIIARGPFPVHYGLDWMKYRGNEKAAYHPHEKPLDIMTWLVDTMTVINATVLDPFMGSGTTGVACMQTGRNFIGIEIDPTYFAIAEKRIAEAQAQMILPLEMG